MEASTRKDKHRNGIWRRRTARVGAAVGVALCTGCASIVSKTNYPVTLLSEPTGASVTIKDKRGLVVHQTTTPSSVILRSSDGYFSPAHYSFEFAKGGYGSTSAQLAASVDGWYIFGNLAFLSYAVIGWLIVDPATGAMFKLDDSVQVTLPPDGSSHSPSHPAQLPPPAIPSTSVRYAPSDFANHAQKNATAAVLVFDARGGISADEAALMTDRFSVELGRMEVYRLVSQSKMKDVLEMQQVSAACSTVECAVEAGQLLGVEYIIYGSIGRIGTLYTINVYVTSVERGNILASETVDHRGGIESLLTEGMAQAMGKLLIKTMER